MTLILVTGLVRSTRMLMPFLEVFPCNAVEIMRVRKSGLEERGKDQIQPVATRSRRQPVDVESAFNWLNSDKLNLQKIRDSHQGDPVLSTVYDWVDRGVRLDLSSLSADGREIKYLWGQFPSLEISSGVSIRRLINAGMSPKVQILIPRDL